MTRMRWSTIAAIAIAALAGVPSAADARATHRPDAQLIVTLQADRVARDQPRSSATAITTIAGTRPLTGAPTGLPVLASTTDAKDRTWLRVSIPGRPAGRTGWITTVDNTRSSTAWRLRVGLRSRTVDVYDGSHRVRRFRAIVGAPATPTPRGEFFIEEGVALGAAQGGPFALATSARSEVLQEFNGGPGQIALHGTQGLTGKLGTASSHGCIRLTSKAITWLTERIGPGTPISVY